jgi:hypothetical protein
MRKGIVLIALVALLAAQASAFTLKSGDLRMKFINYDSASLYAGGLPTAYTYDGATACDNNTLLQALNAYPVPGAQGTTGLEDSWGILYATTIYDVNDPLNPIWTAASSNIEITGIYYGLEDIYARKNAGVATSRVYSRGMKVKVFSDAAQDFDPSLGTGARSAIDQYPTATDGTLLMELDGTPGIFWGDEGDGIPIPRLLDASFRTSFDFAALTGLGDMYGDVVPGTGNWADATDWGMECSLVQAIPAVSHDGTNWIFRDNPGTKDDGADWKFHWTVEPTAVADWTVLSNDPAATCVDVIPEPATLSLLGLGLLGVARRRRRRK